jgi:hypothetical protein
MRVTGGNKGWQQGQAVVVALLLLALTGCRSPTTTSTARSAVEQLLLSTAVDRSLPVLDLQALSGKRVYLDNAGFDGYDKAYALAALRGRITAAGGRLVEKAEDSEVTLESRAGALAIYESVNMIGIPSVKLPIPMAGPLETPEIALFKRSVYEGVAKVAVDGVRREAAEPVVTAGPEVGRSRYTRWEILFFPFSTTNIPELK